MLIVDTDSVVVERSLLTGWVGLSSLWGRVAALGLCPVAGLTHGDRHCAVSASPGELPGLRQDARVVARGMAAASR